MGMSWHRRGAWVFTSQKLLQSRLEFGYPGGGDIPNFVQIHTDIIVDQNVAHAADRLPVQLRKVAPRNGRNPLGSLADRRAR